MTKVWKNEMVEATQLLNPHGINPTFEHYTRTTGNFRYSIMTGINGYIIVTSRISRAETFISNSYSNINSAKRAVRKMIQRGDFITL